MRDFKHSRGPPVRHMVSQFKGKENDDDSDDDDDDDIVLYLVSQSKGEPSTNQSWGFVRVYLDLATHVVEPA